MQITNSNLTSARYNQRQMDQAENMNQLRAGIEEMAHGIQDNSAASQETSATSQELASQAEVLNQMVQKFELC